MISRLTRPWWRVALAALVVVVVAALGASGLYLHHRAPDANRPSWGLQEQLWRAPSTAARKAAALRLLIVGASVTHGVGASTHDRDYASDLSRMLASDTGRSVRETVWSRPGARVAEADHWQLPGGQRLVIVQLITNDFIQATPLPTYERDLSRLLARVRSTSPGASLLCVGAWEPQDRVNRAGTTAAAYDMAEQSACGPYGGYISLNPLFNRADLHGPRGRPTHLGAGDYFHPNDRGHLRLAEALLAELKTENALPASR